jgi:hypothetical protein
VHVVQVWQRLVPPPTRERVTSFDHGIGDCLGPGCKSAAPALGLVGHGDMVVVSVLGLAFVAPGRADRVTVSRL